MRRLSQQQIDDAIDRAREMDKKRSGNRTITTGYQLEQGVPTWSEWQSIHFRRAKTVVNATFVVNTFGGPLYVVQHKTDVGTVRDEADVFLENWTRVLGDPKKPERRKSPATMPLSERLKRAKNALVTIRSQLQGEDVVTPDDPEEAAIVDRVKRMWIVVECARSVVVSRSPQDIDRLVKAVEGLR